MPVEVSLAEREDTDTSCLSGQAKEYLAVWTSYCACAAFNALFWSIEGVRPVGLDDVCSGGLREALDVADVFRRICPRLVRILSERARNEDEVYRSRWQLSQDHVEVFNFAADDGRAAQAVQLADRAR